MIQIPYTLADVKRQEKKALFTVVSLFAGCGGSSTGYRLAGGKILGVNEFIPAAIETYKANYPDTIVIPDDIRTLTGKKILQIIGKKSIDILDGSPPCASFSMAGKREKLWGKVKKYSDSSQRVDDLFFEFAKILDEIQPKVFIAENVKGLTVGGAKYLLGSKSPSLFEDDSTIIKTLEKCGYNVACKVLNSADYGVPQGRERLIFIGVRRDLNILPTHPKRTVAKYITVEEAFKGMKYDKQELIDIELDPTFKVQQVLIQVKEGFDGSSIVGEGKYFNIFRIHRKKISPTITASHYNFIRHFEEQRFLTINECKRLMSFPDDFILSGIRKQQWERLGRAVPPLMMQAIAQHVYKEILCAE